MALSNDTLNVLDIVKGTTVDGPGFRTSIYVAGCRHQCPGCHNPESWSFDSGTPMTPDDIMAIVKEEDFDVTFSGGDPLYHPETISALADRIHALGHTVWVYTGFTWEEINDNPRLLECTAHFDVIVEGRFIKDLADRDLLFRGSKNQRIIDVAASLGKEDIILWHKDV